MTEVRLKDIDKPLGMEVAFLSLLVPAVLAKTASGICEEKKMATSGKPCSQPH